MIKISFSGLDFFPSTSFTDETNVNYRIVPIDDDIVQSSVQWNGTTSIVQSIFYDAYKLTFLVREEKKNGFSKIRYAPNITIYNSETLKTINAKFLDVEFTKIAENLEFYTCVFSFADMDKKQIQNNFGNRELNISGSNFDYFVRFDFSVGSASASYGTNFKPILSYDYSENVKNDFKDKIVDYNKKTKIYKVLFFINENELLGFYNVISLVGLDSSAYSIRITEGVSTSIIVQDVRQFNLISNELLGQSLYKIELDLIVSNTITANYN